MPPLSERLRDLVNAVTFDALDEGDWLPFLIVSGAIVIVGVLAVVMHLVSIENWRGWLGAR